jgi:hypothetical protein
MTNWILVLLLYAHGLGGSPARAKAVTVFTTQAECVAAGEQWKAAKEEGQYQQYRKEYICVADVEKI